MFDAVAHGELLIDCTPSVMPMLDEKKLYTNNTKVSIAFY
jgi:hypothetical protein